MNMQDVWDKNFKLKNLKVNENKFLKELADHMGTLNQTKWEGTDFLKTKRWGHNHDFGDGIVVKGAMEDRHIRMAGHFQPEVKDKTVLVIGCYTGGDALLISALGAKEVYCIEEHKTYAEIASWLFKSFGREVRMGIGSIEQKDLLKLLPTRFDVIYNAGVVYHCKDIIGALQNCYDLLKKDGTMYLESFMHDVKESICIYAGKQDQGYNWFIPSPLALKKMCIDIGFGVNFIAKEGSRILYECTKS